MFGSKKRKSENLVATGARAVGTITRVRDTGMTINDNPRVEMVFHVQPLDGAGAFEVSKTKTVSRVQIPQPGQRYPVWYDAEDPSSFVFAAAVDPGEGRQQIVALFGDAFGPDGSGVGLAAAPAAPAAAPSPAPAADVTQRIAQLDALKAAGVVDDAEYADQKARILASL